MVSSLSSPKMTVVRETEGRVPRERAMDDILEQLLNNTPDAVLVADRKGIITFWNCGAERLFGYSSAEATGKSLDLIIPENLRSRHGDGYRRVMATGETKYRTGLLSSPGIRKDGTRVSLEFSMVPLRDTTGMRLHHAGRDEEVAAGEGAAGATGGMRGTTHGFLTGPTSPRPDVCTLHLSCSASTVRTPGASGHGRTGPDAIP
jgi:PAS domain S-box-containing protein